MGNEFYLTDDDCMQYCKELGNGQYIFIQVIWIDVANKDKRAINAKDEIDNYVVVSEVVDISEMTREDMELAISGYYESIEEMERLYGFPQEELGQLIAECIFENLWTQTDRVSEVVSWDDAKDIVRRFIDSDGKIF